MAELSVAELSMAKMSWPKRPWPKYPWPKCPNTSLMTIRVFNSLTSFEDGIIYFKLGRKLNIETKEEKMKFDLTVLMFQYVLVAIVCPKIKQDGFIYFELNATMQKSLDDITK